jgi:hypothetical protein
MDSRDPKDNQPTDGIDDQNRRAFSKIRTLLGSLKLVASQEREVLTEHRSHAEQVNSAPNQYQSSIRKDK